MAGETAAKGAEERFLRQWENIGISNDFVFCKVMQDVGLLSGLVRLVLPDLGFSSLRVMAQRGVEIGRDIRGVRFDIFATLEDGEAVEIEMQVLDKGSLPKRMRYYASMADMQMLEKGEVYGRLRDSYVVMICPFDHYGRGRHVYTFTNRCREDPSLEMGDGCTKIVLNAAGTADDVGGGLKAFLDYVAGGAPSDAYTERLDGAVRKARANKEWRREYMTLMMRDLENRELGREEGREEGRAQGRREGRAQGRREGQKQVAELFGRLLRQGRTEDAARASQDPKYCEQLLAQCGLS